MCRESWKDPEALRARVITPSPFTMDEKMKSRKVMELVAISKAPPQKKNNGVAHGYL